MEKYGDTHNFGKRVRPVGQKWLLKPRSTFWEELFLSGESKFRKRLEQILGGEPIMECIPRIVFKKQKNEPFSTLVERIRVKPLVEGAFDLEFVLEALGGLFAICSWLGIDDLHKENIFFGSCVKTGELILFPVDIEMVFTKVRVPTQLGILPKLRREDIVGILQFAPFIKNPSARESLAVAYAYMRTSEKLLANSKQVLKALNETPGIRTAPIRAALRNTQDYDVHAGRLPIKFLIEKNKALIEEELIQMRRGDVPYFFSTISDPRIRYFSTPDLSRSTIVKNPKRTMATFLGVLTLEEIFSNRKRNQMLLEYGPLLLISYFLPKHFIGEVRYKNIFLRASERSVHIRFKEGPLIKGARNWKTWLI